MAKYRAVYTKIWKDPDYQEYNAEAKLLFLYLITNDSVTESGIYPLTVKTASHEIGLSIIKVAKLLKNGLKNVIYDIENRLVFVVNFKNYNRGGKPQLVERSIANDFEAYHKSFLWSDFVKNYPQYEECLLTVGKPLVNSCGESGTNLSLNLNPNHNPIVTSDADKDVTEIDIVLFEDFYKPFPRHEGKAAGEKAWNKIKDKDKPEIIEALQKQIKTKHLNVEDKKYCPLPATWLNGRRWEDDIIPKQDDDNEGEKVMCRCGAVFMLKYQGQECPRCQKPYPSEGQRPQEG